MKRLRSKSKSWKEAARRLAVVCSLCFLSGKFVSTVALASSTNATTRENFTGTLELLDGSILHGQLGGISAAQGLKWEHPDAAAPIGLKADNLAWIRFANAKAITSQAQATCQFRFANGDEFLGNLLALDENEVELQTWFGGNFKTPRSALRSIRFLPKGGLRIYEGPTGLADWQLGKNQNPESWQFSDGSFVANSVGTLGRDLKLPGASRLEFDLAWTAPFSLLFSFYTGVFDGFNYNSSCYMFYINPGSISLQRINAGNGSSSLGRSAVIPEMLSKKKVHLEFRASKQESLIELLVDGKPVSRWVDGAGWVANGSGILFYAQTDGSGLRISNLSAAEWDGQPGSEAMTNAAPPVDQLLLANRDKVSGNVTALRAGKFDVASPSGALQIPSARVTQLFFHGQATQTNQHGPWEVQASVAGGGRISFALENWGREKVSGRSQSFGLISLDPRSIRQVQFNPAQSKRSLELGSSNDTIWEADEP